MDLVTVIGGVAAFCTTVSYFPQLRKCWQTGHTGDLSLIMFSVLGIGVALWIVYGLMKSDVIIILANAVSLALLLASFTSSCVKRGANECSFADLRLPRRGWRPSGTYRRHLPCSVPQVGPRH